MNAKTIFDKAQLMRGSLEGCILKIIEKETTYGYGILVDLKEIGFMDLNEGTIYPILLRLEKQGNITAELKSSPFGPKRKYYSITAQGKEYLNDFYTSWKYINEIVSSVFEE